MEEIPSDDPEDNDKDSTEEEEEDSDELYLPDDSLKLTMTMMLKGKFRRQLTS